eukprot:g5457.t1
MLLARFLILVPGHGDVDRWPHVRQSIRTLQTSFANSRYFNQERAVDCVIYTWRSRKDYDLERLAGTGPQNCTVVREEDAHYGKALHKAYESHVRATVIKVVENRGLHKSSSSSGAEGQQGKHLHAGRGAGAGAVVPRLLPASASDGRYENEDDGNSSIQKYHYDYVLVLLDDVAVLRFDPDTFFPVMWENEVSVLQPHSLCAASSRLGKLLHSDPSLCIYCWWHSRTFEMQFTVFTADAYACFAEELLQNVGRVKGGFDKLADEFWHNKWGEVPYEFGADHKMWAMMSPRHHTTSKSSMGDHDHHEQLREEQEVLPAGGTGYDMKVVYPVAHIWFRAITLHLVWAVPQGVLYLARDNDVRLSKGEKRRQNDVDFGIKLLAEQDVDVEKSVVVEADVVDSEDTGREPEDVVVGGEDGIREGEQQQHMKRELVISHAAEVEDEASSSSSFEKAAAGDRSASGSSSEESSTFWTFSLIKMQRKWMVRKFFEWRRSIVQQCAKLYNYPPTWSATGIRAVAAEPSSDPKILPDDIDEKSRSPRRLPPHLNATSLPQFRRFLLSERSCLSEDHQFRLHQLAMSGKPLFLQFALPTLFAPLSEAELRTVVSAGTSTSEDRTIETTSTERSLGDNVGQRLRAALREMVVPSSSSAGGDASGTGSTDEATDASDPPTDEAGPSLSRLLRSPALFHELLSAASEGAGKTKKKMNPDEESDPLDILLHYLVVETGGRHPWTAENPETAAYLQKQAHLLHNRLHRDARSLFEGAIAFATALTDGFSVETELLPRPLRELTKTRFLLSREPLNEITLHLSSRQKKALMRNFFLPGSSSSSIFSQPQNPGRTFTGRLPLVDHSLAAPTPTGLKMAPLAAAEEGAPGEMLGEQYYFDRALKFDPFAVAQYNLAKNPGIRNKKSERYQNVFTKKMAVGESSRLVRGGRTREQAPFTQLLDLEFDLKFVRDYHADWLPALNDHSIVNLHSCSEANQIAANDPNRHIGINEQGWDRETSKIV